MKRPAACQSGGGCALAPTHRLRWYSPDGMHRLEAFMCSDHANERIKVEPMVRQVTELAAKA